MADRRVRPIYDAIDVHNYKQALKLCNQFLKKKDASHQLVSVLKAISLHRLGKTSEAEQLADEVAKQNPTEESVLSALSLCFRLMRKLDVLTNIYEAAFAKNPKSEELLQSVFSSYVNRGDYVKTKETAMKFQKLFPKNKYLMWVIECTFLQVKPGDPNNPLLRLAETMYEQRVIKEKKVNNLEALQLYIQILNHQNKFDKILETIEGDLKSLFKVEEERLVLKADLHVKLAQFDSALDTYRSLISDYDSDNWSYYSAYFDLREKLVEKKELTVSQFQEDNEKFITQLREANPIKRSVYLASLENHVRVLKLKSNDGEYPIWKNIIGLVIDYYQRYGSALCCFSDLKPYLKFCRSQTDQADFAGKMIQQNDLIGKTETILEIQDQQQLAKRLYQFTCFQQIIRYCGYHDQLPNQEKIELTKQLVSIYLKCIATIKKEITEHSPADKLLIISAHILRDMAFQTPKEVDRYSLLIEAASVLEMGLIASPFSYDIKITLLMIYSYLGAIKASFEIFEGLEVKHILTDTLSYLILDDLVRNGLYDEVLLVCQHIDDFHYDNNKNTPDHIIRAFNHESYSKIREFIDFKDKLERSTQAATSIVESTWAKFTKHDNTPLEAQEFLMQSCPEVNITQSFYEHLEANDDFGVIPSWDNTDKGTLQLVNTYLNSSAVRLGKTNNEMMQLLQLRGLTLHILLESFQYQKESTKQSLVEHVSRFEAILSTLNLSKQQSDLVGSFEQLAWHLVLLVLKTTLLFIDRSDVIQGKQATEDDTLSKGTELFTAINQTVAELTKRVLDDLYIKDDQKIVNGRVFPQIIFLVNYNLSWILLFTQFWNTFVPIAKKKKSTEPKIVTDFQNFIVTIKGEAKKSLISLEEVLLTILKSPNCSFNLNVEPKLDISNVESSRRKVTTTVSRNYEAILKQIVSVIKNKKALLKAT